MQLSRRGGLRRQCHAAALTLPIFLILATRCPSDFVPDGSGRQASRQADGSIEMQLPMGASPKMMPVFLSMLAVPLQPAISADSAAASTAATPEQGAALLLSIVAFFTALYFLREYFEERSRCCQKCGTVVIEMMVGRWEIKPGGTDTKARRYMCQSCGFQSEFTRPLKRLDKALLPEQVPLPSPTPADVPAEEKVKESVQS
eukprot:TRINITY_DN25732_c0_g1_i1.p1 TRINITY_DN25732_c0_g1~~TRINITY_DN25732_c0_g1_i1.p1  ORF type:complete len:202 (-),score=38.29 TRINITY_DN25732_c0_g1_i1:50-655(-)